MSRCGVVFDKIWLGVLAYSLHFNRNTTHRILVCGIFEMCPCMCVCACVWMYVRVWVCVCVSMCVPVCVRVFVRMNASLVDRTKTFSYKSAMFFIITYTIITPSNDILGDDVTHITGLHFEGHII